MEIDMVLMGIQIGLFYVTFWGGVVSFFFNKYFPIALWEQFCIWAGAIIIEVLVMLTLAAIFGKVTDKEINPKVIVEDDVAQKMEKELAEIHAANQESRQ